MNWHQQYNDQRTYSQRLADSIAGGMGSWAFIIVQTIIVIMWIGLNLYGYTAKWDPYPFILLNLIFSTQAAYAAPIIMMSQNRAAERDRAQAQADYETNVAAKEEIEDLQHQLARLETEKLDEILRILRDK